MKDTSRTKQELIEELSNLKHRIRELEHSDSERKRVVETLLKSKQQLNLIMDNIPVSVAYVNSKDLSYQFVNQGYASAFGMSPEQMIGKEVKEILGEEAYLRALPYIERVRLGERVVYENIVPIHGEPRWFSLDYIPQFDEQGIVQNILALIRDITVRKQAQKKLRDSEEKYRLIAENTVDMISIMDLNLRRTYVSPASMRLHGFTVEEAMEQTLEQILTPESMRLSLAVFEEEMQLEAGGTADPDRTRIMEVEEYKKDGSTIWVEVSLSFLRDKDGKPVEIIMVTRDITERKQADEALVKSEDKLRLITENMLDCVALVDASGTYQYATPSYRETLGYNRGEMIGIKGFSLIHPDDVDRIFKLFMEGFEKGWHEVNYETRLRHKDGYYVPMEIRVRSLNDQQGKIIGGVLAARDITKRLQLEQERQVADEESRRLASVVLHSRELVNLATPDGAMIFLNDAGKKMLGIPEEDVAQTNIMQVIPENLQDKVRQEVLPAISRDGYWEGDLQYLNLKTGVLTDVYAITYKIADPDTGELQFLANVSLDITDRKRAEEVNAKLENQLFQSQKIEAIGQLAGGIAHDFNNILGAISGFTELALGQVPADSKANKYLKNIFKSSRRAVDLVNQIMTFSHKKEKELQPVRLSPLIKEALKLISSATPTTIDIRQNMTAEPDMVMADATYIHQVVMNLCTNANFAMQKEGGVLSIGLVNETIVPGDIQHPGVNPGHYLKLTVSDTGEGIDPAHIAMIFDPFFTTKKQGEGTGLGLSVIHGIVKSLGGEIKVESRLGQGTSFEILLPLLDNFLPENISEEQVAESIKGSGRILFVDDEEDLIEMATEMLESLGYEVTATQKSVAALEMFCANPDRFDLVITDQTMPELTGMAMAQEMMMIRPGIPVILCTGFSSTVDAQDVKNAGIRKFVLKPMIKNEIAASIHQILKNGRA